MSREYTIGPADSILHTEPHAQNVNWLSTDVLGRHTTDRGRFVSLITAAAKEITNRYPDYFSQHSVKAPPYERIAAEVLLVPPFQSFSKDQLMSALVRGIQILDDLGCSIELNSPEPDAISDLLMKSILDAYAAALGTIALKPSPEPAGLTALSPDSFCPVEKTSNEIQYVISGGRGPPLLVISTTGAPLSIWSTLFGDPEGPRCIAVQSRCGPLLEGGTPHSSRHQDDVADIRSVLHAACIETVDIVAWCNGARTAIALAQTDPSRVGSIMLISPTFHGVFDNDKYPSPFEDNLRSTYEMLFSDPDTGIYMLTTLLEAANAEPEILSIEATKRADAILRLPPRACIKDLLIPLSSAESFRNYLGRVSNDEDYNLVNALRDIHAPITLVTGTHDPAVNPRLARDFLALYGREVTHVTVFGAGHHLHILQYSYFKYLLDHFTARSTPTGAARVSVEMLARSN